MSTEFYNKFVGIGDRPSTLSKLNRTKTQCPNYIWVVGCDRCVRMKCKLFKRFYPTAEGGTIECYKK
jgi:hypothetical protein